LPERATFYGRDVERIMSFFAAFMGYVAAAIATSILKRLALAGDLEAERFCRLRVAGVPEVVNDARRLFESLTGLVGA
jgi:hypothetical protein